MVIWLLCVASCGDQHAPPGNSLDGSHDPAQMDDAGEGEVGDASAPDPLDASGPDMGSDATVPDDASAMGPDGSAGDGGSADAGDGGDDAGGGGGNGGSTGARVDAGHGEGHEDAGNTNPPDPAPWGSSIEVGRTMWGRDYALRSDAPAGGTLFSVWTRVPDAGGSYPWTHGNMNVYVLRGADWYLICLVGNMSAESPSDARYSANSMLFARRGDVWLGDYSYYESGGGQPEAPYLGWVWAAWQVVVEDQAFVIRQWLKFGMHGPVFAAGSSRLEFAQARALLVAAGYGESEASAWQPADAVSFQVGADHGYLFHARMDARGDVPSLDELDAIARSTQPDASAWADYDFSWTSSGASLSDRSGHGRHLTLAEGGALHAGPPGPAP